MKYLYRNRKTGEVVETTNRVFGGNWEPVEQEQPEQENQEPEPENQEPEPENQEPEPENQEPKKPTSRRKK